MHTGIVDYIACGRWVSNQARASQHSTTTKVIAVVELSQESSINLLLYAISPNLILPLVNTLNVPFSGVFFLS